MLVGDGPMKVLLVALFAVLVPMAGAAQTGALVSIELQIYNPGVDPVLGQPVQVNSFTYATAVCNQAPPPTPTGTVFNPTRVLWDDTIAGRVCIADRGTVLNALPILPGDYRGTVTVTDDRQLTSPRSAASNPFGRASSPAARTGLRVVS
jgi:hypothetical protein